jgi:hypothetical protein
MGHQFKMPGQEYVLMNIAKRRILRYPLSNGSSLANNPDFGRFTQPPFANAAGFEGGVRTKKRENGDGMGKQIPIDFSRSSTI